MNWLIEELESQISMYGLVDDAKKINELKRAIVLLEKNDNVFWFPTMMNFRTIEQKPATPPPLPPPAVQSFPKPYPGISPSPTAPSPTASATLHPSQFLNNYHEPNVGEEIFGILKDEDGTMRQCLYTWKESDNPKEISCYAVGVDAKFSAGQRWMPCKKHKSDKVLLICTNECCRQPK